MGGVEGLVHGLVHPPRSYRPQLDEFPGLRSPSCLGRTPLDEKELGGESARIWDERKGPSCSFRENALSTTLGTVRFQRRLGMSGDSPFNSTRSTVENGLGVGFLELCGLCVGSRGWEGSCVWELVPFSP